VADKKPAVPAEVPVYKRDELDVPDSVYLLPREKKFPVKRLKDGRWVYSCKDLRDAIFLAARHGYKSVLKKAQELYAEHCKGDEDD
jgi:hypothetical protein